MGGGQGVVLILVSGLLSRASAFACALAFAKWVRIWSRAVFLFLASFRMLGLFSVCFRARRRGFVRLCLNDLLSVSV